MVDRGSHHGVEVMEATVAIFAAIAAFAIEVGIATIAP